jgi:hypothetical protein
MSRSRRKTNICGITMAATEKADKQKANRAERHTVKSAMALNRELKCCRQNAKSATSGLWQKMAKLILTLQKIRN